ncbi:AaceriAFL067Wp [[Ashbya] aceris (nom. inval.)]|nr:AaceriAFL067Wp [[Ashbya] aceris (nom. inval.)]
MLCSLWDATLTCVSRLFSLEALDARLAPSNDPKIRQRITMQATPSRWKTTEFKFYYVVFAIAVPLMFKAAIDATNAWNPNYEKIEPLLSDGWLFGRKVDNSDSQYGFFRENVFLLFGLAAAHLLTKRIALLIFPIQKLTFDLYFGLFFIVMAHGVNTIRVLIHAIIMFGLARIFRNQRKAATLLCWAYGIGTLFFNNKYDTYPFGNILPFLSFLDTSYKGLIERWDVFYNFTLLRILSFNLDYLEKWTNEAPQGVSSSTLSSPELDGFKEGKTPELLDERSRLSAPHPISDYNMGTYLAYVTYTPLYIAGPILTFNDYLYQTRRTLPSINPSRTFYYALNFLCCIMTMEVVLHFIYVVAAAKAKAWEGDTPFQLSMIGLFNLNIIWLKLLIPWRFFRLWALLDGVDPPENMLRCVDNNYSTLAFWRAWHRSYNKWVVRYIYVPLGGSGNRVLTSLAVFSFVAIWHDIELRLLVWGWLIVLFLLPEIVAATIFRAYSNRTWYRFLCSAGAIINIWMMMIANLVGFCLGTDGTLKLVKDIFGTVNGISFFIVATGALVVGTQTMFEQREHEKRKGIYVKC